jgi:hypothetical protein
MVLLGSGSANATEPLDVLETAEPLLDALRCVEQAGASCPGLPL